MRCPILVLVFLWVPGAASVSQTAEGTWKVLPNSPDAEAQRHDDVFFVDVLTGYLVNTRGEIWKTTDGGESWSQKLSKGSETRFRSVGFANDLVGWAGTVMSPAELLYETRDGGETWTDITNRISGQDPAGICGLSVVDESVAFGVGAFFGQPFLIRTVDGGQNWFSFSLAQHTATLIDVHFFDRNVGIAVGGNSPDLEGEAVVLRTTSGGLTWSRVYTSTRADGVGGEWGWKISFPSPDVGYVSVEYLNNTNLEPAKVLKTVDGGRTWNAIAIDGSTESRGLQGVGFLTDRVGYTSGRGTTSMTVDGGETWSQLAAEEPDNPTGQLDGRVNRIRIVNDTLAYAIGRRVYRFSGLPASTAIEGFPNRPQTFSIDQNYPNPFTPSTTIGYDLFRREHVRIEVYDLWGRRIRTLVDEQQEPGRYNVSWDGRTASGRRLAAGAYMYLIDVGDSQEMKQMVLLR
jgi:photosystem II stability/assembly factor-like uncharacterized protein